MGSTEKLTTYSTKGEDKQNKTGTHYSGGHHYAQTNTNNVHKTRTVLQEIGGKDEHN